VGLIYIKELNIYGPMGFPGVLYNKISLINMKVMAKWIFSGKNGLSVCDCAFFFTLRIKTFSGFFGEIGLIWG